ncbi:MAG: stage II sporulation protein E, partial [Deltaproteobacteria bacterium]|nr:stage II sporulation protein E [Deltaproteobacteria bacterium]
MAVIIIVVISRDFAWLAGIEPNPTSLAQAQLSVMYEVLFIMAVLLGLVVNLIFSYSRNLKLLFENETDILERVSRGDLSRRVPVATNDEFGVIAGHTNTMIRGLKHRIKLLSALKMAEELQQNLLPQHPPAHPGLDVAGKIIYCY